MKQPASVVLGVVGLLAALVVWKGVISPRAWQSRYRAQAMEALDSPDPEVRKQAAWAAIDWPDPALEAFMIRGVMGAESQADVREAYVYSLGRLGNPRSFAAIEFSLDLEPNGYVRAAAWLAAARIDSKHFYTLVETCPRPDRPWDQIGIAQGRLSLGDVRGVDRLLHWALAGDDTQRNVASRALFKGLQPLLDAAGRWPVDASVEEGQPWPPAFVREIEQRCVGLPLQAIADEARRHSAAAYRVRRNVARLTGTRERLAGLLF
jgi:hypothetical protein